MNIIKANEPVIPMANLMKMIKNLTASDIEQSPQQVHCTLTNKVEFFFPEVHSTLAPLLQVMVSAMAGTEEDMPIKTDNMNMAINILG